MDQELTPAQLERIKAQRALKFKAMGLPAGAGQIADIPVEHIPTQKVYAPQQVIQEDVVHSQYETVRSQYETIQPQQQQQQPQQTTATFEVPNEQNVAKQIAEQLQQERNLRQAALYTAPRDKYNALESIRRGLKKQEFKTFIKAESSGVNGVQLPEPKVGKRRQTRPGQPQEKSKHAIEPQAFITKKSAEADMLEGMFTDRPTGINVKSSGVPKGNLIEHDENYSNMGPTFDPVAHLKKKAAEKGVNVDFTNRPKVTNPESANFEQTGQMMLMMETMMEAMSKNQQKNQDLGALKEMMETVAKRVAEDTIKRILKEYVESQKKKNLFEVVNKEKNVVKIDNKYYQLKPVTVNVIKS